MAGYRPAYTLEEQQKILKFILDNNKTHLLRGRQAWQELEAANIINRTWQSAKEHFIKQIFPKLSHPSLGLTEDEIKKIREGFRNTQQVGGQNKSVENVLSTSISQASQFDLRDLLDSDEEL